MGNQRRGATGVAWRQVRPASLYTTPETGPSGGRSHRRHPVSADISQLSNQNQPGWCRRLMIGRLHSCNVDPARRTSSPRSAFASISKSNLGNPELDGISLARQSHVQKRRSVPGSLVLELRVRPINGSLPWRGPASHQKPPLQNDTGHILSELARVQASTSQLWPYLPLIFAAMSATVPTSFAI